MVTRGAFTALIAAVALQRLFELERSRCNERRIRAMGGSEHAPGQVAWMKALHTGWLAGSCLEVWLRRPAPPLGLVGSALAAFVAGQWLRRSAMRALGWRWNVRILTLPRAPLVAGGPYRHLRHPNYVGVALEIAALPLLGGAYWSALLFSVANAALLRARIREEQTALDRALRA